MKRIGCLSDTHGFLHPRVKDFFHPVDEVWHAGDVGDLSILDALNEEKTLRAVYGNIDGNDIRKVLPAHQTFRIEKLRVWMTHIAGYPGNYDRLVREELAANPPGLLICGHSHILRVMFDKKYNLLFINPGAAGKSGFHKKMTAVRFIIDGPLVRDLEIWEMERG
jgi:uncharacterized protein